jgi:hypothetical protein
VQHINDHVRAAGTAQALRDLLAAARTDQNGFTLMFRHAAREPEFAGYAADTTAWAIRESEQILRRFESDPVMRRWAAEMTVTVSFQSIVTWLEHGDPARDEDFCRRLLAVTRTVGKPPKE